MRASDAHDIAYLSTYSTMASSSSVPSRRRCCRCNGTAKCLRCACVRSGTPCSHCLPGEAGKCHNTIPRGHSTVSILSPSSSGRFSQPSHNSTPSSPPVCGPELPSLSTIFQASIPTLQHVPKGARDRWGRVLSDCLSSVVESPDDISCWSRVFMLTKCVLASPSTGHRLRWREILGLVKMRI